MPPKIKRSECTGCGICVFQCGCDVFTMEAESSKSKVSDPRECVDCFICERFCPRQAIVVTVGRPK